MTFEAGDTLTCLGGVPDNFIREGETVTVVDVDEDGVPTVELAPTDEVPAGRNLRVPEELSGCFAKA